MTGLHAIQKPAVNPKNWIHGRLFFALRQPKHRLRMATATLTRPIHTAAATAADGLPRANVRRSGSFDESQFVNLPNVPVFAEHETVLGKDQRQIKFGRDELSAICNRCNQRIRETGDYAAVTLGHTPSPDAAEKGAQQPEVVGYAGPFRMGLLGEAGERQRFAILADFHIFKEDFQRVRKKFARRSPEVWVEDRVDQMFLDPIALLGAEAPRLDMGLMLYSASRSGRAIEKYAFAGPMNAFVSDSDVLGEAKKKTRRPILQRPIPTQLTTATKT